MSEELKLLKDKHSKYFKLCLNSLSHHYTGLDTSRLTAIYFSVLGLDLINELESINRQEVIDYIYSMQLSFSHSDLIGQSGFIGSSYLGQTYHYEGIKCSSSISESCFLPFLQGHIAMTYSAISSLKALGDNFERIDKISIIEALKYLQEDNGAFRSTFSPGECDMRFLYCACAISSLLGDWSGVNKEKAVNFIRSCLTYEGGFSLTPGTEAHGGSTYCALASLYLMNLLPNSSNTNEIQENTQIFTNDEIELILNWCLKRQSIGGYNGRCNKECDSCYSFWIGASIYLLNSFHLTDIVSTRTALLKSHQSNLIGGFSKLPNSLPDILHSFYSLAWLTISRENETQQINPAYCLRIDRL